MLRTIRADETNSQSSVSHLGLVDPVVLAAGPSSKTLGEPQGDLLPGILNRVASMDDVPGWCRQQVSEYIHIAQLYGLKGYMLNSRRSVWLLQNIIK
jgi:hypothetical protein